MNTIPTLTEISSDIPIVPQLIPFEMNTTTTRIPNDRDAEYGLIGACIAGKFDDIRAAGVNEEHFFDIRASAMWRLLNQLDKDRTEITPATVIHSAKQLNSVETSDILAAESACHSPSNWPYWASIADEKRKARVIMEVGQKLAEEAATTDSPAQLASNAESIIFRLNTSISEQKDTRGESFQRIVEMLEQAHNDKQIGVPTGFFQLDRLLGGMRGGQLITLAARPAVGKSALACNIAEKLVMSGTPVAFYSFEMSDDELNMRMLCSMSDTNLVGDVLNRGLDAGQRERVMSSAANYMPKLRKAPLYIEDNGNLTVAQIASDARRKVRNHGIKVVIVDYMQLIQPSPEDRKAQRHVQVGNITRALKQLAMELNIPVLGLAQLGRQTSGKPLLSDLRESGSIEQDSDVVLFLYVENPMIADGPNMLVNVAVGKNRAGRQGVVDLVFVRNKLRFETTLGHDKWLDEKRKSQAA
jgi:replicative DNA helicase